MSHKTFVPLEIVARRLGVPVSWIRSEAEAGRVPSLKVGRQRLFNIEAVEASLMQRAASVPADDDIAP